MLFIENTNITKKLSKIFGILIFIFAVCFIHANAEAATLSISPSGGGVSVGKSITVRVIVNSGGQSINAVAGALTFSNNLLSLTSISKSNSIITLWAQEPTFSNSGGTASFQGVVLNGFSGSGTVLTLTFKAKAQGDAAISFSGGGSSVLLNDGQGTNALSGTNNGSFAITEAHAVSTPTPTPVVQPQPEQIPTPIPVPVVTTPVPAQETIPTQSFAPVFTDYQSPLLPENFVVVKGTGTANTFITMTFTTVTQSGETNVSQSTVPVSDTGTFTYVSDAKVIEGDTYTLIATGQDGQHTSPLVLAVKNSLSYTILAWLNDALAIKVSGLFALLLLIILLALFYRNRVLKKRLKIVVDRIQEIELNQK